MLVSRADIDSMQKRYRANFINSISGFKSLNLVGTRSKDGISNLAPFNSIVHIGSNPPYLGMIARPVTEEHQTVKNIMETNYYTLNHVNEGIYKQAHQTSAKYDAKTSEFEACGLTEMKNEISDVPYVLESNLSMLMKLVEIVPIPLNGTSLIIGEILEIRMTKQAIEDDGYVKLDELGTITCVGVDAYFNVNKLGRIPYATINK